jgi:hypothetical protein
LSSALIARRIDVGEPSPATGHGIDFTARLRAASRLAGSAFAFVLVLGLSVPVPSW